MCGPHFACDDENFLLSYMDQFTSYDLQMSYIWYYYLPITYPSSWIWASFFVQRVRATCWRVRAVLGLWPSARSRHVLARSRRPIPWSARTTCNVHISLLRCPIEEQFVALRTILVKLHFRLLFHLKTLHMLRDIHPPIWTRISPHVFSKI